MENKSKNKKDAPVTKVLKNSKTQNSGKAHSEKKNYDDDGLENEAQELLSAEAAALVIEYREPVQVWVQKVCDQLDLELVETDLFSAGRRPILRIYIDKEGGVTVDDCTLLSRELGTILDLEDVLPFAYHLEVSSPGVDRPLKAIKDWKRNLNRFVKMTFENPREAKKIWVGQIVEIFEAENSVKVKVTVKKDEVDWVLELNEILNAKIEIQF